MREKRITLKISERTHTRLIAIQENTRDPDTGKVEALPDIVAQLVYR
jgi:hypothetical protein